MKNTKNAFTLIELIVVVAILAIAGLLLGGISYGSYQYIVHGR